MVTIMADSGVNPAIGRSLVEMEEMVRRSGNMVYKEMVYKKMVKRNGNFEPMSM